MEIVHKRLRKLQRMEKMVQISSFYDKSIHKIYRNRNKENLEKDVNNDFNEIKKKFYH